MHQPVLDMWPSLMNWIAWGNNTQPHCSCTDQCWKCDHSLYQNVDTIILFHSDVHHNYLFKGTTNIQQETISNWLQLSKFKQGSEVMSHLSYKWLDYSIGGNTLSLLVVWMGYLCAERSLVQIQTWSSHHIADRELLLHSNAYYSYLFNSSMNIQWEAICH